MTAEHDGSILSVEHLTVHFPYGNRLLLPPKDFVHAIDDISFFVKRKEIVGIVGESGSGKTTIGNVVVKLVRPSSASSLVKFENEDVFSQNLAQERAYRRNVQMIFQDPYDSLNPRSRAVDAISQPLIAQGLVRNGTGKMQMVTNALKVVGLNLAEVLYKYPHQLSGGQRQRIAVARAIVTRPKLIIADEPVSMLDVSVRSEILNLMLDLRRDLDLTWLFISHDLAVTRYVSDRIMVIYLGRIMETGPTEEILGHPEHPYTQLLVATVPAIDSALEDYPRAKVKIRGEIPSGINPAPGCRFQSRCPYAFEECRKIDPPLIEVKPDHYVACLLVRAENLKGPESARSGHRIRMA